MGTEAGIMGILLIPGLIYATEGSQEKGNMGAGFYRHQGATGGFCKVGRDQEGASSNRAEHAAACIALEDAKASPDGDILRDILKLLRTRIELGLFTLFVKIKSHREEFFNEMADRWADKSRDTETEARWTSLRQRPLFTWTVLGKAYRSTMSKVVKTRAHLMAARLQVPDHNNLTAKFLKREGNCRSDLGDHWKDK